MRVPMRPAAPTMTSLMTMFFLKSGAGFHRRQQFLLFSGLMGTSGSRSSSPAKTQLRHRRFHGNGIGLQEKRADERKHLQMQLERAFG